MLHVHGENGLTSSTYLCFDTESVGPSAATTSKSRTGQLSCHSSKYRSKEQIQLTASCRAGQQEEREMKGMPKYPHRQTLATEASNRQVVELEKSCGKRFFCGEQKVFI